MLANYVLRSALVLARPVLAAYLPALTHGLHVFARSDSSMEWSDVNVVKGASGALLKGAVMAGLQLDVPPSRVRLRREMDGGVSVRLDSLKKLAEQGVGEGCRVIAEVMPLPYVLVSLGSSSLTTEVVIVPNAHADALKKAIINELKLDAPATRLRLLRVADAPDMLIPLESSKTLAEQGVGEGSRVIAEVMPLPYVLVSLDSYPLTTKVVFASDSHPDDLKDAIIAKLKLDVSATRLRLLRVADAPEKPTPLESSKTLAEQGVGVGSHVVAEVMPLPTTPLVYRMKLRKGTSHPVSDNFTSSSFDALRGGGRLVHMKVSKGGDIALSVACTLKRAAEVCAMGPDDYLLLEDSAIMMLDDVSNLKGFTKNMADGFEQLSNKALAINMDLQRVYGKLKPLNDGRGVAFFKGADAFVECDGLFVSGEALVLNEAKAHFHEADVTKLLNVTAVRLREILAEPAKFTSNSAGIMLQFAGLKLDGLVASSDNFSAGAERDCAKAGIHLLRRDGSGFICTLSEHALKPVGEEQ